MPSHSSASLSGSRSLTIISPLRWASPMLVYHMCSWWHPSSITTRTGARPPSSRSVTSTGTGRSQKAGSSASTLVRLQHCPCIHSATSLPQSRAGGGSAPGSHAHIWTVTVSSHPPLPLTSVTVLSHICPSSLKTTKAPIATAARSQVPSLPPPACHVSTASRTTLVHSRALACLSAAVFPSMVPAISCSQPPPSIW